MGVHSLDQEVSRPQIDGITVLRKLGVRVWKARDTVSGELLAIKVGPRHDESLLYEAQAINAVQEHLQFHPHSRVRSCNFASVYALWNQPEATYLAKHYIKARNAFEAKYFMWATIARKLIDMSDIVAYGHKANVLLNDIPPENWLELGMRIDSRGRAAPSLALIDLGGAMLRPESADHKHRIRRIAARTDADITPGYQSPDALRGKHDASADVYSLGVTGHFMLTNEHLSGEDDADALENRIDELTEQVEREGLPIAAYRGKTPLVVQRTVVKALRRELTLMGFREGMMAGMSRKVQKRYAL